MKAIQIHATGGPEVLGLQTVPDPTPGPGQIVVRVHFVGINPVETYIRAGKYPLTKSLPFTPGTDAGGEVSSVGSGVSEFKPGDRVYTAGSISGTYAPLALCDAAQVHRLPDNASFQDGAAIGVPYGTAWRAIHLRGHVIAGETLLIHGASGGVGIAATQIAKAAGITVFGTAGTEQGLKLVQAQGADRVFNHHDPDYLQKITDATGGRGVDAILEFLANVNLNKDLGLLAKEGRVIVVGNRGSVEIDARQTMAKDSSILGMSLNNATPAQLKAIHAGIRAGLANSTLKPVIRTILPLSDAARSHEMILEPGAQGKILLQATDA